MVRSLAAPACMPNILGQDINPKFPSIHAHVEHECWRRCGLHCVAKAVSGTSVDS